MLKIRDKTGAVLFEVKDDENGPQPKDIEMELVDDKNINITKIELNEGEEDADLERLGETAGADSTEAKTS